MRSAVLAAMIAALWSMSPALARSACVSGRSLPRTVSELRKAPGAGPGANGLLLVVVGPFCPRCAALQQQLDRPQSRAQLQSVTCLRYDATVAEGEDVAQRYNVVVFPSVLLIGADGNEIGRITRPRSNRQLLVDLAGLRDGSTSLTRLEALARAMPADPRLRLQLGRRWALRGVRDRASAHLRAAVALDPTNAAGVAAEALLVEGRDLLLSSLSDHAAAAQRLGELRNRYPYSAAANAALLPLARALHHLGQTRQAWRLLSIDPSAAAWFALLERTDPRRGLEHARRAVSGKTPPSSRDQLALGHLLQRVDRWEEAAAVWSTLAAGGSHRRYYRRLLAGARLRGRSEP